MIKNAKYELFHEWDLTCGPYCIYTYTEGKRNKIFCSRPPSQSFWSLIFRFAYSSSSEQYVAAVCLCGFRLLRCVVNRTKTPAATAHGSFTPGLSAGHQLTPYLSGCINS